MTMARHNIAAILLAALCGCGSPSPEITDAAATPSASEAVDEREEAGGGFPLSFRALGTEPFWAIHVSDGRLRYMTPDDPQGQVLEYSREQTSRDAIALRATLNEKELLLSGRIGECSDGMSDRSYPFTISLRIGDEMRHGCARPTES